MRGCLDDRVVDMVVCHLPEKRLYEIGFGRCLMPRSKVRSVPMRDPNRADHPGLPAGKLENAFEDVTRGGLAIGAGDPKGVQFWLGSP